jgi:CRISPR-associated protein Cas6
MGQGAGNTMNAPPVMDDPALDVAFALEGRSLPRDHAQALADALASRLPWLAGHPTAGVHPVKVVPGSGPQGWLSQRARLLLRVPQSLEAALAVLDGCTLGVAGSTLRLGPPTPHRLLPHGTLYAYFVAARSDDEEAFMQDVHAELRALRVDAHTVCGKRQQRDSGAGALVGFSLMLHGLSAADSLTVQGVGIGPHRALGCGLFVPHKSAAAVGT